ncbi:MAG: hypothetical protein EOP00_16270 [Pedobacter sp.]|nr:MAG: hypothetical protein EOP00_16270 [Pedobacter sp.]
MARHKNSIDHNRIDKLDKDFDGYLHYKDWDGKLLFLLRIENGQPVKRYSGLKSVASNSNATVATANSSAGNKKVMVRPVEDPHCYIISWDWYQDCYYETEESTEPYYCDAAVVYNVETVEIPCPPNDGGDGDGGGGPSVDPDECLGVLVFATGQCILDPPETPCTLAKNLLTNGDFKTNFNNIISNVAGSVEKGYTFKFSNNTFTEKTGTANAIDLNITSPVDGWFHNHRQNAGHYATFDMDDVGFIYQTYIDSNIINISNFVTGVATQYGTYLLKIDNINAFKAFGATNFSTGIKIEAIRSKFDDEIGIGIFSLGLDQKKATELALLKVLGSTSGLMLFEGNSNQTKWQARKKVLDEIVNTSCN